MPLDRFVWVLLIGATFATAAPPKKSPPQDAAHSQADSQTVIDVDAMVRARDAGAQPLPAAAAADPTEVPVASDAALPAAADSAAASTDGLAPTASSTPVTADVTDAVPVATTDAAHGTTQTASDVASSTSSAPAAAGSPAPASKLDDAETRLAATCETHATALLDAAQKGDYSTATRDFNARMRSALSPTQFKQAWESLARFGVLQARGQPHLAKMEGYIAVTIPLVYQKANLYAQVACGDDGQVAGFHVKPLELPGS